MKRQRGTSFVELILTMVIVAATIPPLLVAFGELGEKDEEVIPLAVATHLATSALERDVVGKSFANLADSGPTTFSAPFSAYREELVVDYVAASNFTVAVDPLVTDFKRVRVTVTNTTLPQLSVSEETIVTNVEGGL